MPILPDAEPYVADAAPERRVGALLCHGFTGSPGSLRPWALALTEAGVAVRLPRLPGHGTSWQEMNRTRWPDWYGEVERGLDQLRERCDTVVVMGLSMGGTLALRLAQERHDDVAGLVLVNPALHSEDWRLRLLPVLKHLVPSLPGISSDIAKPGVVEPAYDRTPLKALASLAQLWTLTKRDLPKVDQPLLLFHSPVDHVVEPSNSAYLLAHVASTDLEERLCENSYHVATLDHDAPAIFSASIEMCLRLEQPVGSAP